MKILFDNYNHNKCCKSLWGFSVYLEQYKLLFDTGSNGRVLLENIKQLDVDIKEIKYIFITHSHWDHIGGLDSILELNNDITLFVPVSLSKHLITDLKSMVEEVVICTDKPQKLFDNIYTTGLIGKKMPEQSLVIDDVYPKVITGCGHMGIDKITKVAKDVIQKDIKFAIGGFHLLNSDKSIILGVIERIRALGVQKVLATHCTGDEAIEVFKDKFGENFINGGVGSIIKL